MTLIGTLSCSCCFSVVSGVCAGRHSGGQKLAARSLHKRFTDYNMEQIDIHDEPRIEIIANACRSPAGLGLHNHVCIRSVNNKSASSGGVE